MGVQRFTDFGGSRYVGGPGAPTNFKLNDRVGYHVPKDWGQIWCPRLVAALAGSGKATIASIGDSLMRGGVMADLDANGRALPTTPATSCS